MNPCPHCGDRSLMPFCDCPMSQEPFPTIQSMKIPSTPVIDAPKTPREQVIHLLADYATAQADLKAATAPFEAEATRISAAISKATAKERAQIDALEAELKALALQHGPEIFGDKRGLVEHGWRLGLTETEEVEIDGDEQTVCRRILQELKRVEKEIEGAEALGQQTRLRSLGFERLALSSLLSIKLAINKPYVKDNAEESADWFEQYGIRIKASESASVKPAPKPKTPKAAKKPAAPEQLNQEAA